ncbi:EAL domain-containing protein [Methyloligella sp. 2.7D]|uniref:EAL domain-containing protein n=1 Tax=unclassified Methyloligella TaxID=2625955 RepID=UPI00157CF3C7|nr:EAL domain-containing protein [Methyloligella sp. GL2]QKP78322.1 sensor domain-containing phosphodiesterase [Methyloligella sp. GL2]
MRPDRLPEAAAGAHFAAARVLLLLFALIAILFAAAPALAVDAITVNPNYVRIDVTSLAELHEAEGDRLQIETAPGQDGYVGRMAIQAATPGTSPSWLVFALANPTKQRMVRWLIAPRYSLTNSGLYWPELDSDRVSAVTPSLGFKPERVPNNRADIFRVSLEPGQTITFAAELASKDVPRMSLWDPEAYQNKQQDRMLFNGVLLGIAGVLAIFLTAIFAANHRAIFPATALVAWAGLAYLCVDFGFWNKLFPISVERTAVYRAAAEAGLVASIVLFLYTFLRIGLWHNWIRSVFWGWIALQFGLVIFAVIDPEIAAGLTRMSCIPLAAIGTGLVFYLALRGQDRALALIPTWLLFLVWMFGAGMIVIGQLQGDLALSGFLAGLVLILVLLGFSVTQFAFRSGPVAQLGPLTQSQLKALAVDSSGSAIWQWSSGAEEVSVSVEIEETLGLPPGSLNGTLDQFIGHMHPGDRERFRLTLMSLQENHGGDIDLDFRLRRHDGTYLWYELRGHAPESDNPRLLRCVGLLRDVTGIKRSHERLMHDSVHDHLTGLPNRELFMDRLQGAITRMKEAQGNRPTIIFIDIDRFRNVNQSLGLVTGDTMLLTLARRLQRHLNPQDTLARLGGDQFAIMLISEIDPRNVAMLADRVRRSLRTPMKIDGKEIVLTASIGIVVHDGTHDTAQDFLREGEIAMLQAKRAGADRIEIFNPASRSEEEGQLPLESDLRRAIERKQIAVVYQPITRIANNQLAGFEALLRWDHPTRGRLGADDFIPMAEETGLIVELGSYVLKQALEQAAFWHKALPRERDPLFVSVNVSSRQLFRQDLVQDIRHLLASDVVPPGTLRLEITESLLMENPERAVELLDWLRNFGARVALDDFGTGYSSLSYLHRFPCDTIKIDKSLVRDGGLDGTSPLILKSIIMLAHDLGKEVVAEGIESEDHAAHLRDLDCEYGQGFYYGEPMSVKQVAALLHALASHKAKGGRRRAKMAGTGNGNGNGSNGAGGAQAPEPHTQSSAAATGHEPMQGPPDSAPSTPQA